MLFKRIYSIKSMRMQQFANNFAPEQLLNETNRRQTVDKFSRIQLVKQLPIQPLRHAAVLIPVCIVDKEVSLLYTLRAANLRSHGGQVSFPGGMVDEEADKHPIETALRETEEELGIKSTDVEIWGCGNSIVNRGSINVVPVIGCIRRELFLEQLKLNRDEVEDVFTVTIRDLCDPKLRKHTQFVNGHSLPVFTGGKQKIWGLTAVITNLFLTAFVSDNSYNSQIKFVSKL